MADTSKIFLSSVVPSGITPVFDDELPAMMDEEKLMHLPTVFQGEEFSVDFSVTKTYTISSTDYNVVGVVKSIEASNASASKVSDTVARIAGPVTDMFTDEKFFFVLQDMSVVELPPTTTVDYVALVQYKMPSQTSKTNTYSITLEFTHPITSVVETVTVTLSQWVHWSYDKAALIVKALVASRPKKK